MSLEIQNVLKAIHEQTKAMRDQTAAINLLVQSNAEIVDLLIESMGGEGVDEDHHQYDLSGKRIAN